MWRKQLCNVVTWWHAGVLTAGLWFSNHRCRNQARMSQRRLLPLFVCLPFLLDSKDQEYMNRVLSLFFRPCTWTQLNMAIFLKSLLSNFENVLVFRHGRSFRNSVFYWFWLSPQDLPLVWGREKLILLNLGDLWSCLFDAYLSLTNQTLCQDRNIACVLRYVGLWLTVNITSSLVNSVLVAEQSCALTLVYIPMNLLLEALKIECLLKNTAFPHLEATWYCRVFEDKYFIFYVHIRRNVSLAFLHCSLLTCKIITTFHHNLPHL